MTETIQNLVSQFYTTAIPLNRGLTVLCLEAGHRLSHFLLRYAPNDGPLYRRAEFQFDQSARRRTAERIDGLIFAVDLLPALDAAGERRRGACVKALTDYATGLRGNA